MLHIIGCPSCYVSNDIQINTVASLNTIGDDAFRKKYISSQDRGINWRNISR